MPLGMQVDLGPSNIVLDGDPAPPRQKRDRAPQFSAHVYCRQTAGWIKMELGMEVGLGPGHIVLDGDQAPPKKGHSLPIFGLCLLWLNGLMDQDGTWHGGRPWPRPYCVKMGPSSPQKGMAPSFWSMSIVANSCPSQLLLSSCLIFRCLAGLKPWLQCNYCMQLL